MSTERVFYVDASVCPQAGEGTLQSPLCELDSVLALSNTPGGESATAILIGGADLYPENILLSASRRIAVVGRGEVTIGLSSLDGPIFDVQAGSRLYLSNVTVTRSPVAGIRCTGGGVWLDDSRVELNAQGVDAVGCEVVMRRSQIYGSDGDGVRLSEGSVLRMDSSAIVGNGDVSTQSVALRSIASEFDIRYSTIVGNDAELGAGGVPPLSSIFCGGGMAGPVRNSVVVAPGLASISCPWASFETSFIDTPGLDVPDSVVATNWDPTWFVSLEEHDVHISNPESNPWVELAVWALGDPQRDLDGASRRAVPGLVGAAGADTP